MPENAPGADSVMDAADSPTDSPAADRPAASHADDGSAPAAEAHPQSIAIWTVPNLLSFARLAGVPLFLYLLLGPHQDGWALTVLALSAITDWADGKLARLLNQYSRLGELLDPLADRLYILATLVGFMLRDFIPWWVAAIIVGRDLILTVFLPLIARHGYPPPTVLYLGKAATFALLYALPIILLSHAAPAVATPAAAVGYAFLVWGIGMYLWVGALYAKQNLWILTSTPVVPKEERPGARIRPTGSPEGAVSDSVILDGNSDIRARAKGGHPGP